MSGSAHRLRDAIWSIGHDMFSVTIVLARAAIIMLRLWLET